MAVPPKIVIICGEPSGDLHAGTLARELKILRPDIVIEGVGGHHLRSAGGNLLHDIQDTAVLGFFDVLRKLPSFLALKELVLEHIRKTRPQAIVLIDFSGFNLRLLPDLPREIPVFYYISPQVWASREARVKTLKRYVKRMLVLFPFEETFYRKHGVPVQWVGHPLLDLIDPSADTDLFPQDNGPRKQTTTIALLPGSRRQEIRHILPVMAQACQLIAQGIPNSRYIIARSPNVAAELYEKIISRSEGFKPQIISARAYDCIRAADFCLVASGTATLETALLGTPFFIIYRMSLLNYLLYRPQVRLPHIGLVNIIAQKQIVPEFIQFRAAPRAIADQALSLLRDPSQYDGMKNALEKIRASLGRPGAARRAAETILKEL